MQWIAGVALMHVAGCAVLQNVHSRCFMLRSGRHRIVCLYSTHTCGVTVDRDTSLTLLVTSYDRGDNMDPTWLEQ